MISDCLTTNLVVGTVALLVGLLLLKKYINGGAFVIPQTDLSSKNVVITGGNTGIGECTFRQMAKLGCHIVIGARDRLKSEQCVKRIKAETGNNNIEYISLDLSNKDSIQEFAKSISFEKVDYLVNNAAVMAIPDRRQTRDGFQMQFGVNHLGHFYLTHLLWDRINKSDFFRIINVSSLAHKKLLGFFTEPRLNFDDLNATKSYDQNVAYSNSKLCNMMFTKALSQKINPKKGLTVALHPGVVRTELMRYMLGGIMKVVTTIIFPLYWYFTKSSSQGNQTTMYTLLAEDVQNGGYYADCKPDWYNSSVQQKNCNRLWEESEKMLGVTFRV